MKFTSMQEFKDSAEFFPKGRIPPQRIFKGPRRWKYLIKFGGDAWAISTKNGYVVAVDSEGGGCAMRIDAPKRGRKTGKISIQGSPYTPGGSTMFVGNQDGEEKQLSAINAAFDEDTYICRGWPVKWS